MKNISKGGVLILSFIFILSSLTLAQANKIEISTPLSQDTFNIGQNIIVTVSLYDSQNNPVNEEVLIVIEDMGKIRRIEQTIPSNSPTPISLEEKAPSGEWTITAIYMDLEAKSNFYVKKSESAKLSLEGDILKIKNIGNTKYTKIIRIIIGDTVGIKEPNLNIGEEVTYRLIAPEGTYRIRVTDENGEVLLSKESVALTGKAIGILDERVSQGASLTGTIRPEDEDNISYNLLRRSILPYILVFVIVGGAILIAIEKFMRKSQKK